ncbi:MAG: amino acid ABC transporter permease [Hyphomicrobiales bacterium]|nr:amino acid ABC transporter permease [Hyphomicrobiales bacterium]
MATTLTLDNSVNYRRYAWVLLAGGGLILYFGWTAIFGFAPVNACANALVPLFGDAAKALYETAGVNIVYLYEPFECGRLLSGMGMTIWISIVCVIASTIIGVLGAWAQMSGSKILRGVAQGYIQFFRNTPPLVQMYFFFFALSPLLPRVMTDYDVARPMFDAFTWAAISLSFFAGAFNVEIFRSGIEAVPRTMTEAAEALGYTRPQVFRNVVLPLALRVCIPSLTNNLVNLVKTTTLAFAISVPETLFVANQIWSDRVNVLEMMITLFVFYIGLVAILVWMMERWEKAMRIPGYGR